RSGRGSRPPEKKIRRTRARGCLRELTILRKLSGAEVRRTPSPFAEPWWESTDALTSLKRPPSDHACGLFNTIVTTVPITAFSFPLRALRCRKYESSRILG